MCAYELIIWNMKTSNNSDDNLLRGEMLDVSSWKPQRASFHQPQPSSMETQRYSVSGRSFNNQNKLSKEPWNKIYWCMSELELKWLSRAFHAADCVPLLPAVESERGKKEQLCWRREGAPSLLNESQVVVWRKVAGRAGWGRVGLVNSSRVEKRLSNWPETVSWLRLWRWREVRVMMARVRVWGGYILVPLDVWTGPIASIWRRHSSWVGLDETGVSLGFEEGS